MNIRMWTILLALVTIGFSGTAMADNVCDDVNALANIWNELANGVHAGELEELTDAELEQLAAAVNEIDEATMTLASALIEGETAPYANALLEALGELDAAENAKEAVTALDKVVDSIDKITDACDAGE